MRSEPKERIKADDTIISAIFKMAEGNPGAVNVLAQIYKDGSDIDPDNLIGGFGLILILDSFGIYGPRIWMLYKDVCKEDLRVTIGMVRAVQLGYTTITALNRAINNYGDGLNIHDLMTRVEARLPNFKRGEDEPNKAKLPYL